eukprot:1121045-Prymnesium_polylepis.1
MLPRAHEGLRAVRLRHDPPFQSRDLVTGGRVVDAHELVFGTLLERQCASKLALDPRARQAQRHSRVQPSDRQSRLQPKNPTPDYGPYATRTEGHYHVFL